MIRCFDAIRKKSIDTPRARALLESTREKISVIEQLPLTDTTATVIFEIVYNSLRSLGDALRRLEGYETRTHDASLEILRDTTINNQTELNHLPRLKDIRNNEQYRGVKITTEQTIDILEFWKTCGEEILKKAEERAKT